MKKLLCYCLLLLLAGSVQLAYGQAAAIDRERMERDIDIMEKVINELFENMLGNRRGSFYARNGSAQGSYVPGYGVIFVAPAGAGFMGNTRWAFSTENNVVYFHSNRPAPRPSPAPVIVNGKDVIIRREDREDGRYRDEKDKDEKNRDEKNKANRDSRANPVPGSSRRAVTRSQIDSAVAAQTTVIEKTMRDFLANYADAIGQLSGNERVMIIYDVNARKGTRFFDSDGVVTLPRINAEVKREDLQTYRAGKMNRKELDSRIKLNRVAEDREQYQEYKVFAGILETLFTGDRDNLYRLRNVSYSYLPNFGVIYLMDMDVRGNFMRVRTEGNHIRHEFGIMKDDSGKTDSSQVRMMQEAYRLFGSRIRETLLDYGRTLRNLGSDQMILLTVSLPACDDCNVPERVDVSVKKSVLEAYEQNKLTRQQALEAITVGEK